MRFLIAFVSVGLFAQSVDWSQIKNKPTIPTVNAIDYQFTRTNGQGASGDLSSAGASKTVTLTPCPKGLNGSNTGQYLYVSAGTGTAEYVLVAGGTCTSEAPTGTVIFTTVNTHTGAWKLTDPTFGIQSAICALPAGYTAVAVTGSVGTLPVAVSNCGKSLGISIPTGTKLTSGLILEMKAIPADRDSLSGNVFAGNNSPLIPADAGFNSSPFRQPVASKFCTDATGTTGVCEYGSMIYRGNLYFSFANTKLTSINVTSNVATVVTSVSHTLSSGNTVDVSGCTFPNMALCGPAKTVTVLNGTTFTYAATISNGAYADADIVIYPHISANSPVRTYNYITNFAPPEFSGDSSGIGIQATGGAMAAFFYRNPEYRPSGFEDYMFSRQGAIEVGHSTPSQGILNVVGTCINGSGTLPLDNLNPLTIANGRITSIVVNGSGIATLNATVNLNLSLGSQFVISGATVDTNLNGLWEVTAKTTTVATLKKVPLVGVSLPAAATYTDGALSLTLPGCETPYVGQATVDRIDTAASNGHLVSPYTLIYGGTTESLMRSSVASQKYAYAVGKQNYNADPSQLRYYVKMNGEVAGYRGATNSDAYGNPTPLSGIMHVDPARVTVANTTTPTVVKTHTLPYGFLQANRILRIKLAATYSKSDAGHSLTLKTLWNAIAYATFVDTGVGALANHSFTAEWIITCTSAGTPLGFESTATYLNKGIVPGVEIYPFVSNVDPNVTNNTVGFEVTWSNAAVGNSVTVTHFSIEVLN